MIIVRENTLSVLSEVSFDKEKAKKVLFDQFKKNFAKEKVTARSIGNIKRIRFRTYRIIKFTFSLYRLYSMNKKIVRVKTLFL
jgi:hypothetical protein